MEKFFLDSGFSYTLSKMLPYIVWPLIGLIVWLIAKRWITKGYVKLIAFVVAIALPFGLYFSSHPIYEGDFSNNSQPALASKELSEIKEDRLVVITIAGCPFCAESIERMKNFKTRHPEVAIEYRVCANDRDAAIAVKDYSQLAAGKFPVMKAKNGNDLVKVAIDGKFPTFVLVKKSGNIAWVNDNFGAGALDEVVARFQ